MTHRSTAPFIELTLTSGRLVLIRSTDVRGMFVDTTDLACSSATCVFTSATDAPDAAGVVVSETVEEVLAKIQAVEVAK